MSSSMEIDPLGHVPPKSGGDDKTASEKDDVMIIDDKDDDAAKAKEDKSEMKTTFIMPNENEEQPILDMASIINKKDIVKEVVTPEVIEAGSKQIPDGIILKDVKEITEKRLRVCGLSASDSKDVGEVIDICDDDDDCDDLTRVNRSRCLNTNCRSGDGLDVCNAPYVFQYFGFKKSKDTLVCRECFKLAFQHLEHLADMVVEQKPLFDAQFPFNSDVVLLEDSDDESDKDEAAKVKAALSKETLKLIDEEFEDVLEETMKRCNLDFQIKENTKIMAKKINEMEVATKEIDDKFNDALKRMEEFQWLVYKDFMHEIKEEDPVEFEDTIEDTFHPQQRTTQFHLRNNRLSSAASMNPLPLLKRVTSVATKKVTQVGTKTLPGSSQAQQSEQSLSQEIVALESEPVTVPHLPPIGAITRPRLEVGNSVYVMRLSFFTSWVRAKVIEVIRKQTPDNTAVDNLFRVKIESQQLNRKTPTVKVVVGRYLAYPDPSPVRVPVGSRVIAIFKEEGASNFRDNYYSGIIAEVPKPNNKFRYLVFFDDGYAQYVPHDNILLVCEASKNVWEDVHPESKDFIKTYLSQYPERPMVKLGLNEVVKTEWNGKWWVARVKEIDGSLVKMYFDADERTEWIYRGSTRLGPLYIEMMAAKDRQGGKNRHASILKRRNMPYVEYTRNLDDKDGDDEDLVKASELVPSRSVARKSTNKSKPVDENHRLGPVDATVKPKPYIQQEHPGYFTKVPLAEAIKPRLFRPHRCNESCVIWTNYTLIKSKGMSCLLRPLKYGFQRLFCEKRSRPLIAYIAPCGRRLRNHDEIVHYLLITRSELTCDMFDFDPWVSCVTEYKLERTLTSIKDLSYDKENVPISCVNYVDHSFPEFVFYMTERRAMEGVNLNVDSNFLCGCDCTDNCADRSKCSCWRLTIEGAKSIPGINVDEESVGYRYRRLPERVVSGIYECNSQCKCAHTCLNRVAQHPLSVKLQLYKTLMKGWGIRCLNDVPQGSFICIYAGNLLTEQAANEGGKNYGDEYLAELDYIEVIENLKEDYESDVAESDGDAENSKDGGREKSVDDIDEDFNDFESDGDGYSYPDSASSKKPSKYESDRSFSGKVNKSNPGDKNSIRERLRAREPDKKEETKAKGKPAAKSSLKDTDIVNVSDDDETEVRQPSRFTADIDENDNDRRHKSVREYYGEDECIYVMDAKNSGNIGRYLNHSCSPNVFVQNVFVDTHDLRFPWVAFFASRFIKAGDELTWDYNYDVGSVPGKVLHCYCGEVNCRRRLL